MNADKSASIDSSGKATHTAKTSPNSPSLTIGMPLYNNAGTLKRAIQSLLNQTFSDYVLLISDDASKDNTRQLCEALAGQDRRIRYCRQPNNLNYGNFRYLLASASTPYFMFAAGDDWWDPRYIERCMAALTENSRAVLAVSRIEFVDPEGRSTTSTGTRALTGDVTENISTFLRHPSDNSRMYGVIHTDVARRSFPSNDHHAFDWTFSARTLLEGTHLEIDEVLMKRDLTPPDRYVHYVKRDSPRWWNRLFPLMGMSADLWKTDFFWRTPAVRRALFKIFMVKHDEYLQHFHPRIYRMIAPVYRRTIWRI